MQNFNTKTIREIALEMPQTTRIFEEFKIDYCCGGRKPFAEACATAGVDPQIVSQKLEMALANFDRTADLPERKTASDLVDYIVEKHHVFTKNELVRLTALMEKVCAKHGEHYPELYDLQKNFFTLAEDLTLHLVKEEKVLFPYIKQLESSLAQNLGVTPPHFGTVRNPVRMMMTEHDTAGEILLLLRKLSGNYTPPPDVCPSFKALYFGLWDFEKDLHQHIHLENNVLFPQAVEMEAKIFGEEAEKNNTAFVGV